MMRQALACVASACLRRKRRQGPTEVERVIAGRTLVEVQFSVYSVPLGGWTLPKARKWMEDNGLSAKKEVTLKLLNAQGEHRPIVHRFLIDPLTDGIELCRNMPRAAVYLRERQNRGVSLAFR